MYLQTLNVAYSAALAASVSCQGRRRNRFVSVIKSLSLFNYAAKVESTLHQTKPLSMNAGKKPLKLSDFIMGNKKTGIQNKT
jgi:hypothetical protein